MQSAREPHSAHTASPADPPPLSSHGGGHSAHCPTHMARHNDADLGLTLRTDGLPAESRVSESETERRLREERENSEKNQLSLIRMLRQHTQNLLVSNNILLHKTQGQDEPVDQDVIRRQDLSRTASMVSHGSGPMEMMSRKYKLVTSSVLWFCYFSLALNDYIFGPTFGDLSVIMEVEFEAMANFAIIRQSAYTLGSLGGIAFDYTNRQVCLIVLILLSGLSLFLTPFVASIQLLFLIAALNGFSAGSCDVGFHVWILEMFQEGGGPLLQALHFSFGVGVAIAPLISANFLSEHSPCSDNQTRTTFNGSSESEIELIRHNLTIPYSVTGGIVSLGGILLLALYLYKRYIPPKERQLPVSFDHQMPQQLSRMEKLELWKQSVPSFYIVSIIGFGSALIGIYYGLEVTYFQFLAEFSTITMSIKGRDSANLEAATGLAYAVGGLLATLASFRLQPQNMVYVNFYLMNVGVVIVAFVWESSLVAFCIGNVIFGFGLSSCYATIYTFLEHQVNVTNLVGSLFLFTGGLGTSLLPLFLRNICSNPIYFVYMNIFCVNLSLLLFVVMHVITKIRYKQVKLIKTQLLKDPAKLTHFKERSPSSLSYEPQ